MMESVNSYELPGTCSVQRYCASLSGDPCDDDQDNDGVSNIRDNCPLISNPGQNHTKLHYDIRGLYQTPEHFC